jgi:hypothetical protein
MKHKKRAVAITPQAFQNRVEKFLQYIATERIQWEGAVVTA